MTKEYTWGPVGALMSHEQVGLSSDQKLVRVHEHGSVLVTGTSIL